MILRRTRDNHLGARPAPARGPRSEASAPEAPRCGDRGRGCNGRSRGRSHRDGRPRPEEGNPKRTVGAVANRGPSESRVHGAESDAQVSSQERHSDRHRGSPGLSGKEENNLQTGLSTTLASVRPFALLGGRDPECSRGLRAYGRGPDLAQGSGAPAIPPDPPSSAGRKPGLAINQARALPKEVS